MRVARCATRPNVLHILASLLVALGPFARLVRAQAGAPDPRVGLKAGMTDAGEASRAMQLIGHAPRAPGFSDPTSVESFDFANSDLAFSGALVFQGNYNGFQVWDIANPAKPKLRTAFACPGGQGDLSVYGNLLFMSVEETRGRVDCGTTPIEDSVSAERFRGVRIFDISDLDHPRQVAAVQTCRGSHTHTLVPDPKDAGIMYVYVQGTSVVRPGTELAGCSDKPPADDPNSSRFRIDIIRVPLAAPAQAKVVAGPRIFADSTGAIAGLWKGGDHGPGTQNTDETDQCHDITAYPAVGLAAGACSGNGVLLDIRDPANPKRVTAASDPNFAYWHSATFNNDATTLLFTDEWGGGGEPKCRASDRPEWGADAIFTLANGVLTPGGYFKIPAAQTSAENCVAHNGSLIPVPGRDLFVQSWYQGGISIVDFTDAAHPVEVGYFDRGPVQADKMIVAGFWSSYWYNGHIVGSEIARGLDIFQLKPTSQLSQHEIDAAALVTVDRLNPQSQARLVWPPSVVVARAYLDQLARNGGLARAELERTGKELDAAEKLSGASRRAAFTKLATALHGEADGSGDARRVHALAGVVGELAAH